MCEKSYVYKLNTKNPSLKLTPFEKEIRKFSSKIWVLQNNLFQKKNNVNHFEVVVTLIFDIFLSRLIQSQITQKLQEGDLKFPIFFEVDEIAPKIAYLV